MTSECVLAIDLCTGGPKVALVAVAMTSVTEGEQAVLQLRLSSNTYGRLFIPVHVAAVDAADGEVISTTSLMIEVDDGVTSAEIRIPIDDDALEEPTEYFTLWVGAEDAIPYRFADAGNLVTVLDNDGQKPTDSTPPVVDKHRNVIVERGGSRPAWVWYAPPSAKDAVDGSLPAMCNPAPMSKMRVGKTKVTCTATDAAGNAGSSAFQVTVRSSKKAGSVVAIGGDHRCVAPGRPAWIEVEGFTSGAQVTIQLQPSNLDVVQLASVRADRKGRIRQIVTIPSAPAGDADIVVIGPAGTNDLVRMLPVKVAKTRAHHGGRLMAILRNRHCD